MTTIAKVKVPLLGVRVSPLRRDELLRHIQEAVLGDRRLIVAGHNLHSVYLWHQLPELRDFYHRAGAVIIDGMPVLALLRFAPSVRTGGVGRAAGASRWSTEHRLGSTDWVDGLVELDAVTRVTTLGGTPEAADAALKHFSSLSRRVVWQTIPADPWQAAELDAVCDRIRRHAPQILLIGMGMPLQERLAVELSQRLDVPVIATVGGALDQLGGVQSLAPRWLGSWGLEWAWRLASDPRRLAGRYLLEPPKLAALLLRRDR
ncbi:WecB/TagA/CpsF family glycosyltransferase [Nesterenkonia lutea]|uniref:N-acetylglucosaminyldiphosphoundecaprenol N-acetyl-beta-D-mannosaminyltransferase n=1 Tax=Nesterenkonia lutea TaxID=272919 RepID=A0ABR9JCV1_9MICC|nr:WecB/TagA/CpsF family glycosyltransferase [Nesterenkonia lutea]MBE1523763.1 N-acetylglucosaminyldiphosphoundecaprenol N-acetyl-beta-D-mannosaminyltransferase [Nesterenkonia lutea]